MDPITSNPDVARGWLAAFVDGEGCVYYRTGSASRRVITITVTEPELIEAAAACCDLLGIGYARSDRPGSTPERQHRYTLEIRRAADMARFREEVPIQHPDKRRKLDEALSFVRGLYCAGCGCLHDERTEGCTNCRKRHTMRAAQQRHRDRKAAEAAHA